MLRGLLMPLAQALYLFAPLLLSAALAGLVQRHDWFAWLRRPVDGGATLCGQRLFGKSKTWRGFAIAIVGCVAGAAAQRYLLASHAAELAVIDYADLNVLAFGVALGAGAMLGELPNSFVKRQLGIAPGRTAKRGALALLFYVWDQVDMLVGAWPLIAPWVHHVSARLVGASFGLALALHPLISLLGFALGARRTAR